MPNLSSGQSTRNLVDRCNLSVAQARYREGELRKHFPEAWIFGHEPLISAMTNDQKDRHVLAAAVRCNAEVIVTYNRRHFPESALSPYGIECQGPSTLLRCLYDLSPGLVVRKLHEQAESIDLRFEDLLTKLHTPVPSFVRHLRSDLE